MWEVRCTNIPTEYDGKLGSVDGPYFFEKESRPAYHAFLNGGCIDERVPYMKYTYEGLDVYTILGWHDPMWLPGIDEVLMFTMRLVVVWKKNCRSQLQHRQLDKI